VGLESRRGGGGGEGRLDKLIDTAQNHLICMNTTGGARE